MKSVHGWNWMKLDEHGWNWMKLDELGWKWMNLDENGWNWMKMDETGWTWMKMDERTNKWTIQNRFCTVVFLLNSWSVMVCLPSERSPSKHLKSVCNPELPNRFKINQPPSTCPFSKQPNPTQLNPTKPTQATTNRGAKMPNSTPLHKPSQISLDFDLHS